MRRCTKCRKEKLINCFSARRSGQTQSWCRDCIAKATRERRRANAAVRQRNIDENNRRQREIKAEIDEIKASTPCADCKRRWKPWQMQFDHVRGKKKRDIATLVHRGARLLLQEEIKKCELVCANCHSDRTHQRRYSQHHSQVAQ